MSKTAPRILSVGIDYLSHLTNVPQDNPGESSVYMGEVKFLFHSNSRIVGVALREPGGDLVIVPAVPDRAPFVVEEVE